MNNLMNFEFTFHNVSINSQMEFLANKFGYEFTFHNVSINSENNPQGKRELEYLHSTMFLLIQRPVGFG